MGARGDVEQEDYLSAALTLENVLVRFDPKPFTTAMMATEIPAAIQTIVLIVILAEMRISAPSVFVHKATADGADY